MRNCRIFTTVNKIFLQTATAPQASTAQGPSIKQRGQPAIHTDGSPAFPLGPALTCVRHESAGRLGDCILEEGKFQALAGHPVTHAQLAGAGLLASHAEGAVGAVCGRKEAGSERGGSLGANLRRPDGELPPNSPKPARL